MRISVSFKIRFDVYSHASYACTGQLFRFIVYTFYCRAMSMSLQEPKATACEVLSPSPFPNYISTVLLFYSVEGTYEKRGTHFF